jgi:hypothetical protein
VSGTTFGDRQFTITLECLGGRVPVVVVPPADALDRSSTDLTADGRRRSAASALQDWLNADEGALWGMCGNGVLLRLVRNNASLTRPAYIEADLRRIFEGDAFADFAAVWLLMHSSRFGVAGTPPSDCTLERWRTAAQNEGVVARDKLRDGVEATLLSLGNGFLSDSGNAALREQLRTGALPSSEFFGELLRFVYRLIFLLAAEDRNLLHAPDVLAEPRKLYAEGYSVGLLRDRAVRRAAWDRHHDRWEGLLITFAALARGEKRLGLPALGGLFALDAIPHLEAARLANRSLMEAIFRLAWLREQSGLVPVNWRDMETEELGSVYESLLELTPRLVDDGRGFTFAEGDEAKGHARKTTGSYYTPDSLVQTLLDSALDPVLDRAAVEADDPAEALLSVTVLDPACGSGHFLLAAARRIATRLARARTGGVASPADYRHALRDVARACIHGVDRNPMAVELTKVALWIETVEPGKPLGFLDTNIRCGDALFGLFDLKALEKGIPDDAYKPLSGDDKETAKHFLNRNKAERSGQGSLDFGSGGSRLPAAAPMVGDAKALRSMPEDSAEEIDAKRERFETTRSDPRRWNLRIAADLYVAAFLSPKTGGVPANRNTVMTPTTAHVWEAIAGRTVHGPLIGNAQQLAGDARAFHWPLEFPDVTAAGGFDVILGNPPWERAKLQEVEFFSTRSAEISSAPTASKRKALIAALAHSPSGSFDRALFDEYLFRKRGSEAAIQFCRASERFPLSARGDLNTYALFTELGVNGLSPRGHLGIIVPSGIATESATSALFGDLNEKGMIRSFYDFENRGGFFHGLHTKHKFAAVCVSRQRITQIALCFFATSTADIRDPNKRIMLSPSDIQLFNPNTKTLPILRAVHDLELLRKIYSAASPLINRATQENPWAANYLRMFDMTIDSGLFSTSAGEDRVPLYEAKMFWHFDHRWANATENVEGHISSSAKTNPNCSALPRFYVNKSEVESRLLSREWNKDWLIAYRNVSDSRNERTFVSAAIPRCGVGNSATVLTVGQSHLGKVCCLLGMTNSLVFDYAVRQKVPAMNVNVFMVDQFPFLKPDRFQDVDLAFITQRVLELTYTSCSMTAFARDINYDGSPFAWDEDRRAQVRAELDAWYARAYGLTRDELRYILDPADVKGADYPSETFRVLKTNDIRRFGEYRTARLVLQAWDRLERGELAP